MLTRRFIVARVRDDPLSKARVLQELAMENINLEGFTTYEGDLYLLPDYPGKALEVLADLAITAHAEELLQFELSNERGALARVYEALGGSDVRVRASFGFAGSETRGVVFLAVNDLDRAETVLEQAARQPHPLLNR